MKIALLTELFYPHMAGCERRFLEIGKRLARGGHEVHVFTLRHSGNLPKEELIEGMLVHRYADSTNYVSPKRFRSFNGVLKYSFATFFRLLAQDFDVYYSNEWPLLHSLCAKPVASPLVQEWCEVWTNSLKVTLLQKLLKRLGDYHVAVSEFTKQRLLNFLKFDPEEVSLVPNGVDNSRFYSDPHDKVFGRIIYVGRIVPHKHVEMLVDAFHRVKEKASETELHIVGSGSSLLSIEEKASGVNDCFVHGFLPDSRLIDLLKSAWLFILPSEREGSGIAALESMAAGTPVITVNFPNNATKEMIDGMNGLVVSPKAEAIAEATLALLDDENRWLKMSNCACSFAKEYDWELIAKKLEDLLRKVA
ncbi:MAG: glycosyltransferase family 4 protein [Candidatus Bathyarchaeota archaeon]|nr:glycosyltransferase family 4 protein [Candidatus Bathyarchaeota archaeon]